MAKKVIKELIISLLLCLAILLLLGILLYDYAPMRKTVPNPVSYTTPEEIRTELANSEQIDESEIIMTYEVDSTDLDNYKSIQNYKPGKANPFSSYESEEVEEVEPVEESKSSTQGKETGENKSQGGTTGATGSQTSPSSQGNSQNAGETSGGQFFKDKGTK